MKLRHCANRLKRFTMSPNFEKQIVIRSPLKKLVHFKPRKAKDQVTYLTANFVFSERIHFAVKQKILDECKTWIVDHLEGLPKLRVMTMDITYYDNGQIWDIDNRDYFWRKIILDVLKTPTSKQIQKAAKYGREIITLNVIEDDNVKHYKGGKHIYGGKGDMMIIDIKGELLDEQKGLFE